VSSCRQADDFSSRPDRETIRTRCDNKHLATHDRTMHPVIMMTEIPHYWGHWMVIVILTLVVAAAAFLLNVAALAWTGHGLTWSQCGRIILYSAAAITGVVHVLWFVHPIAHKIEYDHPGFDTERQAVEQTITFPDDDASD
jgi:hypothetical protein